MGAVRIIMRGFREMKEWNKDGAKTRYLVPEICMLETGEELFTSQEYEITAYECDFGNHTSWNDFFQ